MDSDEVIHVIYEASLKPELWPVAVAGIGEVCQAARSLLFTPFKSPSEGGIVFPHNIPQVMLERWANSSMQDDPIAQAAVSRGLAVEGSVFVGRDLVTEEELFSSALYRELWRPMQIGHVCTGVVFGYGTDSLPTTALALYRDTSANRFSTNDASQLHTFTRHVSRSLGVMYQLRSKDLEVAVTHAALDRLVVGAVLVDSHQNVRFANTSASQLLARGDLIGVTRHGDKLRLKFPSRLETHARRLQHLLNRVLAPLTSVEGRYGSEALVLTDNDGAPACVVVASPLANTSSINCHVSLSTRAILFLYELGKVDIAASLLQELFGLTAAECRAAIQVLLGGTVKDAAARLGVSVNTVKSQLQAVYAKTRTSRQTELIRLLLALAVAPRK